MQRVRIVTKGHPCIRLEVINVNILIDVDDILSLRVDLDEHLLLAHGLDDLADVGAGLLEVVELLAEHADRGVEFVAAGFEAGEVRCAGVDLVR